MHGTQVTQQRRRHALLGAGMGLLGFVVFALLCATVAFSWVASSPIPAGLGWSSLLAAQRVSSPGGDTISLVTGPLLAVIAVVMTVSGACFGSAAARVPGATTAELG